MPIHVSCAACHRALRVPDSLAGKQAKCPACGVVMAVPPAVREASPVPEKDYEPSDLPPVAPARASRAAPPSPAVTGGGSRGADAPADGDRRDGNSRGDGRKRRDAGRPGTKFCHECGRRIRSRAEICPKCGVRQPVRGRDGGGRRESKKDGIKVCLLVSAISNILVGLLWASTCIGIVFTVPMAILCVFEFMLYAKADRLRPERYGREAKSLSLFMILVGLANTAALVCGIIVMVKSPALSADPDDDEWGDDDLDD